MSLLVEISLHLSSDGLNNRQLDVSLFRNTYFTSSRLLCFCLLADRVDVPDISLFSGLGCGRGMLEGLFSNGTCGRLGVPPRYVPAAADILVEVSDDV